MGLQIGLKGDIMGKNIGVPAMRLTSRDVTKESEFFRMDILSSNSPENNPEKRCTACGDVFPATTEFFHRAKHGKYGLQPKCKKCRESYFNSPEYREHKQAYDKAYRSSPEVQEHMKAYRQLPEIQERERVRQNAYYHTPEGNSCAKAYLSRPEVREHKHDYWKDYSSRPGVKEREQARRRVYNRRPERVEGMLASNRTRRARKNTAPGIHTVQDVRQQFKRQKGKCYWCGEKLKKYHVDHIIPLSRGGSNWPDNIVIACPTCNLSKGTKLPHEFLDGGKLL